MFTRLDLLICCLFSFFFWCEEKKKIKPTSRVNTQYYRINIYLCMYIYKKKRCRDSPWEFIFPGLLFASGFLMFYFNFYRIKKRVIKPAQSRGRSAFTKWPAPATTSRTDLGNLFWITFQSLDSFK